MSFTRALFVVLLLNLFAVLDAPQVEAEVPHTVSYQARVAGIDGAPIADGRHTFLFALWDAPSSGTRAWGEESQSIVTTSGLMTASLGAVMPIPVGTFADSLWLAVTVDGTPLLPRMRIGTSPYASHALIADTSATLRSGAHVQNLTVDTMRITSRIFGPAGDT